MNWLSYLNPLNWPKDLSNSFMSQLEAGIRYILTLILNSFLGMVNAAIQPLMSAYEDIVNLFVNMATAVGPFALPVFTVGMAAVIGAAYLGFGLMKDLPVVGSFA